MGFLDPKPVTSAGLDTATAEKITTPGTATALALDATILDRIEVEVPKLRATSPASRVASVRSRGALCIHLDDGVSSQYSIAAPIAEEYGGRLTFAICADYSSNPAGNPGFMSHAQIRDLAARGHEIANHSQTHANMSTQTPTQRLTEWDASRNFIENTIGVPTKTFVLPFSAGNDAVFTEAYGRYGRIFGSAALPYMRPMADMGTGIAHGRWSWATLGGAGQYVVAELINQAARTGSVLTLITHSVNGTDDANGVTEAEFRAVIELAASLGMAITTAVEAIPEPPRVTDFGFEDASMLFWDKFVGGVQTAASVADTPLTGLTGGRSLKLHGDGTDYPYVLSKIAMPIMESGQHTLSARIRQEKTGGPQGAYIGVREYDANGVQIGGDINSALVTATGSTPWQQISVAYTPNEKTRTVRFTCVQAQVNGDTFFDHLHHGPTRYGVLG